MRDSVRSFLRPAVQLAREAPVWAGAGRAWLGQGRGPGAVFLPAYEPEGAALLRVYNIAAELRRRGWRIHVLPPSLTLAQRRRCLKVLSPDVVLMQGSRHALNRPELYPGQRVVYDIDDADFHLDHLAGPVAEAMTRVDAVIAGSAYIADWCRGAGAREVHVVWTGTPPSKRPRPPQAGRPPVVAWAQTRPMTYTREAALVREVMARVAERVPGVRLRLYDRLPGDDPGFAESFRAPGLEVEWLPRMKYAAYLATFDDVALGLAPLCPETPFSRGKSFGKVLAYLDRGVPVIASDVGEHRAFFDNETGVVSNHPGIWFAEATRLLAEPAERQWMAEAAQQKFLQHLSGGAAAASVDTILTSVMRRDAEVMPG